MVIAASVPCIEVLDMRLSKFRIGIHVIAYAAVVSGLLAGCSGSGDAGGGASATAQPITGVATPGSVSVVTATGTN